MIDHYSKFIVIEMLKNLQSLTVINKCKKIFSQFGTPKELLINNEPKFTFQDLILVCIYTNQMD